MKLPPHLESVRQTPDATAPTLKGHPKCGKQGGGAFTIFEQILHAQNHRSPGTARETNTGTPRNHNLNGRGGNVENQAEAGGDAKTEPGKCIPPKRHDDIPGKKKQTDAEEEAVENEGCEEYCGTIGQMPGEEPERGDRGKDSGARIEILFPGIRTATPRQGERIQPGARRITVRPDSARRGRRTHTEHAIERDKDSAQKPDGDRDKNGVNSKENAEGKFPGLREKPGQTEGAKDRDGGEAPERRTAANRYFSDSAGERVANRNSAQEKNTGAASGKENERDGADKVRDSRAHGSASSGSDHARDKPESGGGVRSSFRTVFNGSEKGDRGEGTAARIASLPSGRRSAARPDTEAAPAPNGISGRPLSRRWGGEQHTGEAAVRHRKAAQRSAGDHDKNSVRGNQTLDAAGTRNPAPERLGYGENQQPGLRHSNGSQNGVSGRETVARFEEVGLRNSDTGSGGREQFFTHESVAYDHISGGPEDIHGTETMSRAETGAALRQVEESILRSASYMQDGQKQEFSLELNPPELGRVRIRIAMREGEELRVRLGVEDSHVRDALRTELAELQRSLGASRPGKNSLELSDYQGGGNNDSDFGGTGERSRENFAHSGSTPSPWNAPRERDIPAGLEGGTLIGNRGHIDYVV